MAITHYTLVYGILMISVFLKSSAKPLTSLQPVEVKNTTAAGNNSELQMMNRTEVDMSVKKKIWSLLWKRRASSKRDTRKNCFGFKIDRISDLSGMGC
ncbi:hypothetical protein PGIGA_G00197510 [Pangasianodon gigas]|uniref:Uncharacterized protein n=1 Tax=Pangasianodon gigas TaxID=30993 RepID=A0ACC5WD57_PANGG|nr:hypothetical protein [Pangasianodon gigas]